MFVSSEFIIFVSFLSFLIFSGVLRVFLWPSFSLFLCLINFFASFLTVEPPSILATGGGFSSFTLLGC